MRPHLRPRVPIPTFWLWVFVCLIVFFNKTPPIYGIQNAETPNVFVLFLFLFLVWVSFGFGVLCLFSFLLLFCFCFVFV